MNTFKKKIMKKIGSVDEKIAKLGSDLCALRALVENKTNGDPTNDDLQRTRQELCSAKKIVQASVGTRRWIENGAAEQNTADCLERLCRRIAYVQSLAEKILVSRGVRVINPARHDAFDPEEHRAIGEVIPSSAADLAGTIAYTENIGFEEVGVIHAADVVLYCDNSASTGKEVPIQNNCS